MALSSRKRDGQGGRLKWVIDQAGLSQAQFSGSLNVAPGHVSNIIRGHRPVTLRFAQKVHAMYGVAVWWLMLGEGEPFSLAPAETTEEPTTTTTQEPRTPPGALRPRKVPATYICPRCNREVAPGDAWCPACMANLDWSEQGTPSRGAK